MKYTNDQLKTINSLKKINDNIYTLHYQNDYGREEIINSSAAGMLNFYINIQDYVYLVSHEIHNKL